MRIGIAVIAVMALLVAGAVWLLGSGDDLPATGSDSDPVASGSPASPTAQFLPQLKPGRDGRVHLVGRVTERSTGAPVAGALVTIGPRRTDAELPAERTIEVRTDGDGAYAAAIDAKPTRQPLLEVESDDHLPWQRELVGTRTRDPSGAYRFDVSLIPALRVAGRVIDQRGDPVAGAKIDTAPTTGHRLFGRPPTTTDADGRFRIRRLPLEPRRGEHAGRLVFRSAFAPAPVVIEDVYALAPAAREHLEIVLSEGPALEGVVEDAAGRPLPDVLVELLYPDPRLRRAARSDASGRFRVDHATAGKARLRVDALAARERAELPIVVSEDVFDFRLQTRRVDVPEPDAVEVLGMRVLELTPAWRDAFDLAPGARLLVLDPGRLMAAQGLELRAGDTIHRAAEHEFDGVRGMAKVIVEDIDRHPSGTSVPEVQFVFGLRHVRVAGLHTQRVPIPESELAALRELAR